MKLPVQLQTLLSKFKKAPVALPPVVKKPGLLRPRNIILGGAGIGFLHGGLEEYSKNKTTPEPDYRTLYLPPESAPDYENELESIIPPEAWIANNSDNMAKEAMSIIIKKLLQ